MPIYSKLTMRISAKLGPNTIQAFSKHACCTVQCACMRMVAATVCWCTSIPAALQAIPLQADHAGINSAVHKANLQVGMKPAWQFPNDELLTLPSMPTGPTPTDSTNGAAQHGQKGTQQRALCLARHARA